ncbi:MAG TPA: hypothetical protein VF326_07635 [Anaerolineaceae bacterium]
MILSYQMLGRPVKANIGLIGICRRRGRPCAYPWRAATKIAHTPTHTQPGPRHTRSVPFTVRATRPGKPRATRPGMPQYLVESGGSPLRVWSQWRRDD